MHRHDTCLHTLWITNSVVHGDSKKSGQSVMNTVIEDILSHAVGGAQASWNRGHL